METTKSVRLVLEATLDRGSIHGVLGAERGEALSFAGWLGLVAAIDAAARHAPPGSVSAAIDLLDERLEPQPGPPCDGGERPPGRSGHAP